jgi:predicted extracellular nuclease
MPRWIVAPLLAVGALLITAAPAAAQATIPIGSVQGSVPDGADGDTHASPLVGQTVQIQGVIRQRTLGRTAAGEPQNGFFIQNTAATADSDPSSSDGIFVFMGRFNDLIGGYVPTVGDEVVIQGRVSEFFNLTELTSARLVQSVRTGVDVQEETPAFEVDPPDGAAEADRYWERREGMAARVPAGSRVVDGRDVFPSTADGEVWVVRGDEPIVRRSNPFARRVFRDPHPLDNRAPLFDDGNGYRILLGSLGIKAVAGDTGALIAPARAFQSVRNALEGGVYFAFGKYSVQTQAQPSLGTGADPSDNAPPRAADPRREYAVATFNLENLYDFRDDPSDGCDFADDTGCPGVSPPFDYVPASDEDYRRRLGEQARQILGSLRAPDILLVQEAEDQDICGVSGTELDCATGSGDGHPDTLQELALAIEARGGPEYEAVLDRDGADDRGIVSGFLYRTDRAHLLESSTQDPVLGATPEVDYRGEPLSYNQDVQNPKVLNATLPGDVDRSTGVDGSDVFTRPPQVALFRLTRGRPILLYAISNHFSSTPDARVGQRTEQARYNAALATAISAQSGSLGSRVLIGGDLNVFPRPDDPFAPGHPLFPSDQLGPLYDQGLRNLYDVVLSREPASAYSYVFEGQAQTLDQLFVSPALRSELEDMRMAHINADWPADFDGDGPRGTSDHDPPVARFER